MDATRDNDRRRQRQGDEAEDVVADLLQAQGLRVLARKARFRFGEVDLVLRDEDTLVFVEVRRRRLRGYGDGAASVDRRKRRRIALAARAWLVRHPTLARAPCRFDVASVSDDGRGLSVTLWRDAFRLDDC